MNKVFIFGLTAVLSVVCSKPLLLPEVQLGVSNFTDVKPSEDLQWTKCFEIFECARLMVPLDYEDVSKGTTAIAFIKAQSTLNDHAEDILFNPGGPGGSGVEYVLNNIQFLRNHFGLQQHNVVGFDPRGISNSGPSMAQSSCATVIHKDPSDRQQCRSLMEDSPIKYISTVAVAQDMLQYVKKRAKVLGKSEDDAKLWFLGTSYGTTLGATFASMYPNRVGRMVLDGVADSKIYYSGQWNRNLKRSTQILDRFVPLCHKAGPFLCHLFDQAEEDIDHRIQQIFTNLERHSIEENRPDGHHLRLEPESLKQIMFLSTYGPLWHFPILDKVLVDVERRNATLAFSLLPSPGTLGSEGVAMTRLDTHGHQTGTIGSEGVMVMCLDAHGHQAAAADNQNANDRTTSHMRRSDFGDYLGVYVTQDAQSQCFSMKLIPPPSQRFPGFQEPKDTFYPILWVGNTLDPVTPVENAFAMQRLFPNSLVLKQDSMGHCSGSSRSNCTTETMQNYFQGTLPQSGTVCKVEHEPFMDQSFYIPD